MDATNNYANRLEAQRLLEIATRLLLASDLIGAKSFAERALDSDPLLPGIDQLLAISDVLLASQLRLPNNQPDFYSILQLSPSSSPSPLNLKQSFRHLSLLLSPPQNTLPFADSALRSVLHAYSFLSNPSSKSLYDSQLQSSRPPPPHPPPPTVRSFWTCCASCRHVFEYDRLYLNRTLRCRVCMHAFRASEMKAAPHVVPGTDMYYCAWGFFPLGFPGSGFAAPGVQALNAVPVNVVDANKGLGLTRGRKAVAKKRVGNYEKKRDLFGETDSEEVEAAGGGEAVAGFEIDLEATEDLLSNLDDLPFV